MRGKGKKFILPKKGSRPAHFMRNKDSKGRRRRRGGPYNERKGEREVLLSIVEKISIKKGLWRKREGRSPSPNPGEGQK